MSSMSKESKKKNQWAYCLWLVNFKQRIYFNWHATDDINNWIDIHIVLIIKEILLIVQQLANMKVSAEDCKESTVLNLQ